MSYKNLTANQQIEFWKFYRGDLSVENFEQYLYNSVEIETQLGEEYYLEAISVNFTDPEQISAYRELLKAELIAPFDCQCHLQPDLGWARLGSWELDNFEFIHKGINGLWWRHQISCKICQTSWFFAEESRIYDIVLFEKETSGNLNELNSYFNLLKAAKNTGAQSHYVDPFNSLEIPYTIADLAIEKPNIRISEIAQLLPVSNEVIVHHSKQMVAKENLKINFEQKFKFSDIFKLLFRK